MFDWVLNAPLKASPTLPFSENLKKVHCLLEKVRNCVYQWVRFLIENTVLRVTRAKISGIYPCRNILLCVVDEIFIGMLLFQETSFS